MWWPRPSTDPRSLPSWLTVPLAPPALLRKAGVMAPPDPCPIDTSPEQLEARAAELHQFARFILQALADPAKATELREAALYFSWLAREQGRK